MARNAFYKKGSWNAICDRCGFQFKSSEMRKTWEGYWVDQKCFETRQPQDFVRGIPDPQAVPWDRPRAGLVFIPIPTSPVPIKDTYGSDIFDTNGQPIYQVP